MDTHKNQFRQISIFEGQLHPSERAAYRQRMREEELAGKRELEERTEKLRRKFEPDHEPNPWELDLDCDFELAMSALAPLTRRQYRSAWKQFDAWRGDRPVNDRNLAQYCWHRFKIPVYWNGQKRDLAPITIRGDIQAVQFRSVNSEQPNPVGPKTKAIMKAISRDGAGRGRGAARGLLEEEIQAMCQHCENEFSLWGLRDAALFLCMWDGLLRCSEACGIDVSDLRETDDPEDNGMKILIRKSKTDQTGKGSWAYIGPATVVRVRRWIKAAGVTEGPLFRGISSGGRAGKGRMSGSTIAVCVRRRAKECGINGAVRTHSFRRGMCQHLSRLGWSIQEIARAGRWKTPGMVIRYIEGQEASTNAVAQMYRRQKPKLRAVR